MLKGVVKEDIGGDESKKILDTCDAAERMPPGVLEACSEGGFDMDSQDFNLVKSIQTSQHSFIITDPSLADNPIVFASDGFLELTGYERDQVLGRNCRFLQGTDTSQESVEEVRNAVKNGVDVSVTMINYTADGTPFWNKLFVAALRDAQNNIVNFIGVVVKVATPEPGHPDHGKTFHDVKYDSLNGDEKAESTIMAMEDSVSAAVAAASGNPF
jgi:PAS domain S-box-containing protein